MRSTKHPEEGKDPGNSRAIAATTHHGTHRRHSDCAMMEVHFTF
jgi:hypothetical protein